MRFCHMTLLSLLFILFGCSQVAVAQTEEAERVRQQELQPDEIPRMGYRGRSIPIIIEPDLTVNQIYDKAIRSVVWILSNGSTASGVLIDKELKLVVTNEHVVGTAENVAVFFPAIDKDGKLIVERDFYLNALQNKDVLDVLHRLGYAALGRVVAKNQATDLAILELAGIADTALEIDHDFRHVGYQINVKDKVHILGNPGKLELWRWTLGEFQSISIEKDDTDMLRINADTYPGHSGGPVLNGRGKLIGIVSKSNLGTSTVAVPLKYVDNLLKELKPIHAVYISNDTIYTIPFKIRGQESDDGEEFTIKPKEGMTITLSVHRGTIPEGYPKIRFDRVPNDNKVTLREETLKTGQRFAGKDFDPIPGQDAYGYYFYHDPSENKLYLTDKLRESSQVE